MRVERLTGYDPATFRLEIWRSTNWTTVAYKRKSETANHSFYILVFWRTEEYLSDSYSACTLFLFLSGLTSFTGMTSLRSPMYGQSPNELEQLIFFLEQRKVVETSSSAWKADVLAVVRPLHENPAYKALLHHHWRAGNNSGQRSSTNGTQP